jgi:ribosome-associated protein
VTARVLANGNLLVGADEVLSSDITVRVTTPGGPGGQHANRTRSRVVVRFDPSTGQLPDAVRARLLARHPDAYEVAVSTYRSQSANKEAALEELARRIEADLKVRRVRRATKATRASGERRLAAKRRRGATKSNRQDPRADD